MKGKNTFTQYEIEQLKALIKERIQAPRDKQKQIRAKMRAIGFYGGDDFGIKDCQLSDFENLIESGRIKVLDYGASTPQAKKVVTTNHMYDIVHCNAMQNTIAPIKKTAMSKAEELMANSSIISNNKKDRDEDYVIDLCDEVLGLTASRQHRFDFLYGDTGAKLPVDAYYKDLNLVVEYQEIQHTQDVKLFDKKMTVSGVSRKEQRKIYDERRAEILPKHGIKLIIISYTAFGTSKRIKRNRMRDLGIVRSILNK